MTSEAIGGEVDGAMGGADGENGGWDDGACVVGGAAAEVLEANGCFGMDGIKEDADVWLIGVDDGVAWLCEPRVVLIKVGAGDGEVGWEGRWLRGLGADGMGSVVWFFEDAER